MTDSARQRPLEIWGGLECTVNRVGDGWFDQLTWSGHDARLDDLDRFADLGLRTLRYPVLWERMAPHSLEHIDWEWSDQRLQRLRELGVRPIVGLVHHGSGPAYTSLLDARFPAQLAAFAGAVARRYPWLRDFTPVNEPLTTARFSGLYGHWYPHHRCDQSYVRALVNQARAVVLAMRAIREVIPQARLIQTEDCGATLGSAGVRSQQQHEDDRRWLTWDLLTGRVTRRHPLMPFLTGAGFTAVDQAFFQQADCRPDVIGLNYYLTSDRYLDHRLEGYRAAVVGGNGHQTYADTEAVRASLEGIVGHETHLLSAWSRYRLPLAITEVHLACTREEQLRWLMESWHGAHAARAQGADVRAVTAWALLGSHNWESLVTRDAGRYEPGVFDIRAPQPRPTALATVIRSLAVGGNADHPVLAGVPWWRRADRIPTARSPMPALLGRPILVVGTGTLGHAVHRIAVQRGLPTRLVGRAELDIVDRPAIDSALEQLQPWAVINAAGYVRVDAAESDAGACHLANVVGPVNLAEACRRNGVRLVTFSSDLVFDGRVDRPYVEADEPNPLNVYGVTKADAERQVLDVLPDALVIRSSAFFGPWDEHNFLARLFQAASGDEPFAAPSDSRVSPTFVPDLVNATLDLLIDQESGIWHLANTGDISWFDFACLALQRSGATAGFVRPVLTSAVWHPARRPPNSALASQRGQLLRPLPEAVDAYLQATRERRLPLHAHQCVAR